MKDSDRVVTGIFGGSFDPPTFAHLKVGQFCLKHARIDELWFLPTSQNPLKQDYPATPSALRLEMLQAALAPLPEIKIETVELFRDTPAYTFDTIHELKRREPDRAFVLIMGMDAFLSLPRWKHASELMKLVRFAVVPRPGMKQPKSSQIVDMDVIFLELPELDISSTEVRSRIKQGRDVSDLAPASVLELIKKYRLYHS